MTQNVEDVLSSAMTDGRMKRTPGTYCGLKYKNSAYYPFSTRHTHMCVTAKQKSFALKRESKKSQMATSNVLDPRVENITKSFRFMCMSDECCIIPVHVFAWLMPAEVRRECWISGTGIRGL